MGKSKKKRRTGTHPEPAHRTRSATWQWVAIISIGVGLGLLLGIQLVRKPAVGSRESVSASAPSTPQTPVPRRAPQRLPNPLDSPNPRVRMAYAFAMEHPEVLARVPCYCGCDRIGHQSSRDCFIHTIDANGKVTLTPHAVQCNICLSIALDSKMLLDQGQSLVQIRNFIDRAYGAFGRGTPTPMPQ